MIVINIIVMKCNSTNGYTYVIYRERDVDRIY